MDDYETVYTNKFGNDSDDSLDEVSDTISDVLSDIISDIIGGVDTTEPIEIVDPDVDSDEETPAVDPIFIENTKPVNFSIDTVAVSPEKRITSNVMSKYEITECISIRSTQIAQYNNCLVDVSDLSDPILMAKRELMMRMCPLLLRRYVGTRDNFEYYEYWNPNEMTLMVGF